LSDSDARPVLGLTTYLQQAQTGIWDVHASFLPAIYMEGVNLAGGTAVLLPPQPVDAADRVLDGLDGVIITGGRDMDPAGYGQQRHPATDEPVQANRERDAWEIALVRGAIRRGMPVLGICRGAQVVNVALGGTLHQRIFDMPERFNHKRTGRGPMTSDEERYGPAHPVALTPGGLFARLAGTTEIMVNSLHGQGIDQPAPKLVVEAMAPDGQIEAVSLPGARFVVGVQWHPEYKPLQNPFSRSLFDAFSQACHATNARTAAKRHAA
jgi:putative glutamine amidotransferase